MSLEEMRERGFNFKQMTDSELFCLIYALERAEFHKDSQLLKKTKNSGESLKSKVSNEYNKRKLHWSMFEKE